MRVYFGRYPTGRRGCGSPVPALFGLGRQCASQRVSCDERGGVNVLRMARDLCLGLEVVMADGAIWNGLGRLRKDNQAMTCAI